MNETYDGRLQTEAKHIILRHYLQELALITFQAGYYPVLTYIDGFSGPWESKGDDYSDTSFMIAIKVLKDVQDQLGARGLRPIVKCFFAERKASSFAELDRMVKPYHAPAEGFHVATFKGKFEDAIPDIMAFAEGFSLTFIDPTGWTNYAFDKIAPLLKRTPGEVLVNFMYDHISRFATSWDKPEIIESFNGILRPGWPDRIDKLLPPGKGAERLFKKEFKEAGGFKFVVSTPIKKLAERIHFCITYGTRHPKGLKVYRGVEYMALREHDFRRFESNLAKEVSGAQEFMFTADDLHQKSTMDAELAAEKKAAAEWLESRLREGGRSLLFQGVWHAMLETFTLRWTDARDVCKEMADRGIILRTWKCAGSKRTKPDDRDWISLVVPALVENSTSL
ncbi:three-Cys-motif partner protein [Sinorhizobium fredii]|uniref:three-Cys-motif partner protein TcmP n=1 Tax=Rhizobium fredii TaxID=380 RepID=UPI003514B516